jgi:pantothenate kinase type III
MTRKIFLAQPKDRFDLLLDPFREEFKQLEEFKIKTLKNFDELEIIWRQAFDFMNRTVAAFTDDPSLLKVKKIRAFVKKVVDFYMDFGKKNLVKSKKKKI